METAILFALALPNRLFSLSETAPVTACKGRIQRLIDGSDSCTAAVKRGEDRMRFLPTLQIGITSISMLKGAVSKPFVLPPTVTRTSLRLMGLKDTSECPTRHVGIAEQAGERARFGLAASGSRTCA